MPQAARSVPPSAVAPKPFNPYAHAARIRRDALALLAAGGTPPRDPFDGIDDKIGEPVKVQRKTAGFGDRS